MPVLGGTSPPQPPNLARSSPPREDLPARSALLQIVRGQRERVGERIPEGPAYPSQRHAPLISVLAAAAGSLGDEGGEDGSAAAMSALLTGGGVTLTRAQFALLRERKLAEAHNAEHARIASMQAQEAARRRSAAGRPPPPPPPPRRFFCGP
jgi:hypothetical protein